jgi:signal transduction histidine kinase
MGLRLLFVVVFGLDLAIRVAAHPSPAGLTIYAAAVAAVLAVSSRWPAAAFPLALTLAALSGSGYVLLLWTSYRAGRHALSRTGSVVVVGAAIGGLGWPLGLALAQPRSAPSLAVSYLVFVLLPLAAGGYLRQHARLVAALSRHNAELRRSHDLLAERGRLHERLRIARDMHDALGHRLGLVSIQAAALEVADLPAPQRGAIGSLAGSARDALTELHDLVGALRNDDEPDAPGLAGIDGLVGGFARAGVPVTLRRTGAPRGLAEASGRAAYRVVEEGLTNAAKHASGRAVTVTLDWESDALLLTVVNEVPETPREAAGRVGSGLAGLRERVEPLGGLLDHRCADGRYRLVAMLPADPDQPEDAETAGRLRTLALGVATAVLLFGLLPAGMLLGVR